jgi:hypothetical protein
MVEGYLEDFNHITDLFDERDCHFGRWPMVTSFSCNLISNLLNMGLDTIGATPMVSQQGCS